MIQQMLAPGLYQRQLDQEEKNFQYGLKIYFITYFGFAAVLLLKYATRSRIEKILFFLISLALFTYFLIDQPYSIIIIGFTLAYYFITIAEDYFEDHLDNFFTWEKFCDSIAFEWK